MATNPRPTSPDTSPEAQAAAASSRIAEGQAAIRAAVLTRKATLGQIQKIAQQYDLTLPSPETVQAALDWSKNKENDPGQISVFLVDPLAQVTGPLENAPVSIAPPLSDVQKEIQRLDIQAPLITAAEMAARPFDEIGAVQQQMRETGWGAYAPLLSVPAAVESLLSGAAGLASQTAANIINPITGERTVSPTRSAEQALGLADFISMMFPFGTTPEIPGAAVKPVNIPAMQSRVASALERAQPLPLPPQQTALRQLAARPVAEAPAPAVRAPAAPAIVPDIQRPTIEIPTAPRPVAAAPAVELPPAPRAAAPVAELPTPIATAAPTSAPVRAAPKAAQLTPEQQALAQYESAGRTIPILEPRTDRKIAQFQQDVAAELKNLGIEQPKVQPDGSRYAFQDFVADHLTAGTLPNDTLAALIEKHQMFGEDDLLSAIGASKEATTRAARVLNLRSQASRQILAWAQIPAFRDSLDRASSALNKLVNPWDYVRRIGRARSGMLTTQIGTMMRNLWGSTPVMPAYSMVTDIADAAIRRGRNVVRSANGAELLQGPSEIDAVYSFLDEMGRMLNLAARKATGGLYKGTARTRQVDEFFKSFAKLFPTKNQELFSRISSDFGKASRGGGIVERGVSGLETLADAANVFNRLGDRFVKNAQFPFILSQEAARKGYDLFKMFDEGTFAELPPSIIDDAIRLMDKRLFNERPTGKVGKAAVTLMENITQPLGLTNFPNFAISFVKYVAEQNPFAIMRYANPAEQAKLAAGDSRGIGKIIAGISGSLAWYTMKDPDDGEWYEMREPVSGALLDMRSLGSPHIPSMFYAFLMHRYEQNDLASVSVKDFVNAVAPANFRAGVGLYAMDKLLDDVGGAGTTEEKFQKILESWAREWGPGWLTFARNFKSITGQFGNEEDVTARSPETMGQAMAEPLPFGSELYQALGGEGPIPERQVLTREAAPRYQDPLLRQVLGTSKREEPNFLEESIARLGMKQSDLYRPTGVPDFDKRMAEEIGRIAEAEIVPMYAEKADTFLAKSRPEQRESIRGVYAWARKQAREQIYSEDPRIQIALKFDRLNTDERKMLNDKMLRERGSTVTDMLRASEGKPVVWEDGQLKDLEPGTEYMDLRDYKLKIRQ